MSTPEFVCCTHRELPPDLRLEAAWHAAVLRPSNAPAVIEAAYVHPHDEPLPPEALTGLKSKFWPNGYEIRTAFQGGNRKTNAKVIEFANHWSNYGNISFIDVGLNDNPDVIVGYDRPGFFSNIGTDSRVLARRGQVTLNLWGFDRGLWPEEEWYRVVEHEPGHAAGLWHEQGRPEVVRRIDPARAVPWFARNQGWDETTTRWNVLTAIDLSLAVASPEPDEGSVMEYALPGEIMYDGKPIDGGKRISRIDMITFARIYPGRGALHPHLAALAVATDAGVC